MDIGCVSKYVKKRYRVTDPNIDGDLFINDLMLISSEYKGSVIFASDDAFLISVSKNKKILKDLFIIEAPDWEITRKLVDKQYTYSIAEQIGVLAPKTFISDNYEEAIQYAKT